MENFRFTFSGHDPIYISANDSQEATDILERDYPNMGGMYTAEQEIDGDWEDLDDLEEDDEYDYDDDDEEE